MKKLLIILLLLGLVGCDRFCKTPIISTKTVHIDPRALEQCRDLLPVNDTASWEDVLVNHADVVEAYYDCRQKQQNSAKLLREFANVEVVQ